MQNKSNRWWGGNPHLHIFGIQVNFHYSWMAIALLGALALAFIYLPRYAPGYPLSAYLFNGAVIVLVCSFSLVCHELAHSFTAIHFGVNVPEITLFLLGGRARVQGEAKKPLHDFLIAFAGPFCSLIFALAFGGVAWGLGIPKNVPFFHVLAWGAYINLVLFVFSMIPGLPLDGGRMFRSILWWKTNSMVRATHIAADVGKGLGFVLIFYGVYQAATGSLLTGGWNAFMGFFIKSAAAINYDFAFLNSVLEHAPVDQILCTDIDRVDAEETLREAVFNHFLRTGHTGYPVVREGRMIGVLTLESIARVDPERHDQVRAAEAMVSLVPEQFIDIDDTMQHALQRMDTLGVRQLFVGSPEKVGGMVTQTGLMRYADVKKVLEDPARRVQSLRKSLGRSTA